MNKVCSRKIFFACICLIATAFPSFAEEQPPSPEKLESLEVQILDQQKKIYRLNKGITEHKTRIRKTRKTEINLLEELEKIDSNLKQQREKIQALKEDHKNQEELVHALQKELIKVLAEKEVAQKHVEQRLQAYYKMGSIGVINVIFSKTTIPDLLTFDEYFRHLVQYDRKIITEFKNMVAELTHTRDTLQEGIKKLVSVIEEVKKQEVTLAQTRQERMILLTRINTEKKLYQQALAEMEEASHGLSSTINSLRKRAQKEKEKIKTAALAKKRLHQSGKDFSAMKGRLNPPVQGTVSTYFGKNTKGKFGITTYANGIDIKTQPGSEITAIFSGKVVYAGRLRGYGNLMIIDHGDQYYSLISRAAQLNKKENEYVATGEVIGIMGDQGGLIGEGLHFEIRHGSKAENPLLWVNNAKLKIKARRRR